jgi:hypothetical protein
MLCALRKVKVEISERKRSDLQKRGKICKLCALIKVRIVQKFLDLEALCSVEVR